jgi:hypothetical protein
MLAALGGALEFAPAASGPSEPRHDASLALSSAPRAEARRVAAIVREAVPEFTALRREGGRAQRDFADQTRACRSELDRFREIPGESERARASRIETAQAVFLYGYFAAIRAPLATPIERYAARLRDAQVTDRRSARGIRAIVRDPAVAGTLPRLSEDVCTTLARWREAEYAPGARPISLREYRRLTGPVATRATQAVEAAERRLRRLGVSRRVAALFAGGLFVRALPGPALGFED